MEVIQNLDIVVAPRGLLIYFSRDPEWSLVIDAQNKVVLVREPGMPQFAVRFEAVRSIVHRVSTGDLVMTWQRGEKGDEDSQTWSVINAEVWKVVTDFLAEHPLPGVAVEQVH